MKTHTPTTGKPTLYLLGTFAIIAAHALGILARVYGWHFWIAAL